MIGKEEKVVAKDSAILILLHANQMNHNSQNAQVCADI